MLHEEVARLALGFERVGDEPARDALEQPLVRAHPLELSVALRAERVELAVHDLLDLGHDQHVDALASRDAAHAVRALRVVAKVHVLAEGEYGHRVGHVLDVGAGGVHLIGVGVRVRVRVRARVRVRVRAGGVHLVVEAEAALERNERVIELDRTRALVRVRVRVRVSVRVRVRVRVRAR